MFVRRYYFYFGHTWFWTSLESDLPETILQSRRWMLYTVRIHHFGNSSHLADLFALTMYRNTRHNLCQHQYYRTWQLLRVHLCPTSTMQNYADPLFMSLWPNETSTRVDADYAAASVYHFFLKKCCCPPVGNSARQLPKGEPWNSL
jgi:hypothetical protein